MGQRRQHSVSRRLPRPADQVSWGRQIVPSVGCVGTETIGAALRFALQLFGVAGFAHRGFRGLHRQLAAVGVTGYLHPLRLEGFGSHPLARKLGEALGLVSIQSEGLCAAIDLADDVALEIVQVGDLRVFVLSTGTKVKSKNSSSENSNGWTVSRKEQAMARSG